MKKNIKKALQNFCNKYPNDKEWTEITQFELDKEHIKGKYRGYGWGDTTGNCPQPYTWATYDTKLGIIQIMFRRGKNEIIHDINLEGEIILHHDSKLPWIDWCRQGN